MSLWSRLKNLVVRTPPRTETMHKLVVEQGNGIWGWNGKLYDSDIIRSCISPFAHAIGKLKAKEIKQSTEGLQVDPDPYIVRLMEEPNPLLTGQMLQQKMAVQLALNNNAFALILRDNYGYASEIYPIEAYSVEALYDTARTLYLRFMLQSGALVAYPYRDIIHLRDHYSGNDVFGESNAEVLDQIMQVADANDKSVVEAVKNGSVIKWIMKWKQIVRPEDLKRQTEDFARQYLETSENGTGVASVDAKADLEQVEPHDYVPNAAQQDRTLQRLYRFFGTNEHIIGSNYTEDEWNAYYESVIEPVAIQLGNEMTRKIFTRRERNEGCRIVYESTSLQYASMNTKLNLLQMVDRGALTPNEWREVMNLGPIDGGDKPIRRLDTAVVGNGAKAERRLKKIVERNK